MKRRSDIMKVLRRRLSPSELELLLVVPLGGENIARFALYRKAVGE